MHCASSEPARNRTASSTRSCCATSGPRTTTCAAAAWRGDAGVLVEIVKVDGIFAMTDDVVDYEFTLAKNLGARAISTEIAVPTLSVLASSPTSTR